MTVYERMKLVLERTGMYDLKKAPRIRAELQAEGEMLENTAAEFQKILEGAFWNTVGSEYASRQERLFGFAQTKDPETEEAQPERQKKIEAMKKRLQITNRSFTKRGMMEALESYGMKTELTEDLVNHTVTVKILEDAGFLETEEEKREAISAMLPCHVTAILEFPESDAS